MSCRECSCLQVRVEHTRMQGAQPLWYSWSSHTWRLHNSGYGCHTEPFTWDSTSLQMGIGQGGASSSSVRSGNQGWFGQFGAMSITEARSSMILYNTSDSILIRGNAYSLAAGHHDVSASPSSGEWDREKNSGQCAFSLVANRSTSALLKQFQIIRTRLLVQPPLSLRNPLPRKHVRPWFRRPRMCAALMERKWQSAYSRRFVACLHRALECTLPWRFMYETDVLSVWISTCCCSSCGRKSFRAKKTASSSKRFIWHRLWGSDHSPEAGMPSQTTPQLRADASVLPTMHNVTKPRGTPRLKRSRLRHGLRASMQPLETAMLKWPKVHAVQGTTI